MLPGADDVVSLCDRLNEMHRLGRVVNRSAVEIALDEARAITLVERNAPGAIFFSFARRGKAFNVYWALLADLLPRYVSAARGLALRATTQELRELRMGVVSRTVDLNDVLRWFAARIAELPN